MAWNRDLILAQKKYLLDMYERTKDVNLEACILVLDDILNFEKYQFLCQSPNFQIRKQENIETLCKFEKFLPDIEKAFRLEKLYTDDFIYNMSTRIITEEEILSFNHDFFKKLDKELYRIFLDVYKYRHSNFQKSKNRSGMFTIGEFGFSYLSIRSTDTIEEYFHAAHEYGHAIHDKILFRTMETDNYPFHELFSLFSEYLSILYYESLHPEDLEDIKCYKKILLSFILNHIIKIIYYYRIIDFNNYSKFGMLLNIKRINHLSFYEARKTLDASLYERFIYAIPFLTLIELLYTEDLEKSIYIIKKLIQLPNNSDYVSELVTHGIILTEHLSDFIKYTEKNHDSKILHL